MAFLRFCYLRVLLRTIHKLLTQPFKVDGGDVGQRAGLVPFRSRVVASFELRLMMRTTVMVVIRPRRRFRLVDSSGSSAQLRRLPSTAAI